MNDERAQPELADSLLDGPMDVIGVEKPAGVSKRSWTRVLRMTPTGLVSATVSGIMSRKRTSAGVLAALLIGAGVLGWLSWRVEPPPDYANDSLDVLFEYTLLTDDFNRLPLEERVALIEQLVERMRAFGSGDSVLLAMFASMIMGEARAQLEENISRLAIDVSDKYASTYDPNAPEDEKTAYLQDAFLGMTTMFDFVDGEVGEHTPEELLEEARLQARRDLDRFEKGKVGAGEVVRIFDLMNNKIGKHMSGHQKMRTAAMFRDMTEMLREGP